jgi:hypothetical protein
MKLLLIIIAFTILHACKVTTTEQPPHDLIRISNYIYYLDSDILVSHNGKTKESDVLKRILADLSKNNKIISISPVFDAHTQILGYIIIFDNWSGF